MARVFDSPLPAPLGHKEHYEPYRRRRRLGEVIISGFNSLLRRSSSGTSQGRAAIAWRGAGYVVWVPRGEQLQHQQRQEEEDEKGVWDEDIRGEEEGEEGGCTPVVLYGGGHGGLFTVRKIRELQHLSHPTTHTVIPSGLSPKTWDGVRTTCLLF